MKLLFVSHIASDQLSLVRLCKALGELTLSLALDMEQAVQNCKLNSYDILLVAAGLPALDCCKLKAACSSAIVFIGDEEALSQLTLTYGSGLRFIVKPITSEALQELKLVQPDDDDDDDDELGMAYDCLDFSYIEKLTRGKVELKMDLMEIFVEVVGEETGKVEAALPKADWVQISSSMHRMKSNLRMFGCLQVVEVVGEIENHARNTIDLDSCQQAIISIMPELKKLLNSVKGEMARLN